MIKYIVVAITAAFMYISGYTMAKNTYLERGLEEKTKLVTSYEEYIDELKIKQAETEAQAEHYRNAANRVSTTAERLRTKFSSLQATACVVDKSKSSNGTDSRRTEALGEVLGFATTLIEERDRIALQYNELRKSCNVH